MKEVKIIIVGDGKKEYLLLKKSNYFNSLSRKLDFLKKDPQYGFQISKKLIPLEYKRKYEVNNLWKINISRGKRLIYTIKGEENQILVIILDILSHKHYENKFKY